MPRRFWLLKSEPDVFSIDDLRRAPKQTTCWEGVRNYQARNFLRDDVKRGDGVLFYHSNAAPPAVAGTATVAREAYPDEAQFDPKSEYHDPAARRDAPRWYMIDIQFEGAFARPIPLDELRAIPALREMVLLQKGSRLSVQPVTAEQWKVITKLGRAR